VLSPTPHYHQIMGRAAEIARAQGSPAGGAEHLFLGMLHDGGWPVSVISPLVDLGQAEVAVLGIVNSPGYSPPPAPPLRARNYVQPWGADVAAEMGDSHIGLEHALLAMVRSRDTVPARALAGLADLDAVEAAVVAAKNAPGGPPPGAVYLPDGQELDRPLQRAIIDALPEGTTFGFNIDADQRMWLHVFETGGRGQDLTRQVLNTALASLDRPALGS
jgi:hypothetical protein